MKFGFKILEKNHHKIVLYDGETKIILSKIFCVAANYKYLPNDYCNQNNDLFITPDGKIKLCRYLGNEISIVEEIKKHDEEALNYKLNLANKLLGRNCPLKTNENTLAVYGGNPIMKKEDGKFIHPHITKKLEDAVIDQLHDTISIYASGKIFEKFENEFAKYHGKKYGLVVSSGTSAIHSLFDSINLKSGDEIICPIYTFFATISPIFQTGATPIFVDCDETGNIDYKKIESKISEKTKAIIVTHMWGYPCKMDKIKELSDKYGIYLFEDCSHAHGGSYHGRKLGSWGDAAIFSLQGSKIITGGEGGIIITNNKNIYKNCILFGQYNKRCKQIISKNSVEYNYAITGKGLKLRAHPLAIRIAYELFNDLDRINAMKQRIVAIIEKAVKDIDGLDLNTSYKNSINSYYALIFKYDPTKFNNVPIESFLKALQAEGGIEFDKPGSTCPLNRLELFMNPTYLYPNYSNIINNKDKFPNADKFYDYTFKLPVWYNIDDIDIVLKYCDILKKVSNYYKKIGGKNEIL